MPIRVYSGCLLLLASLTLAACSGSAAGVDQSGPPSSEVVAGLLEEIMDDGGATMIEWPERIEQLLPEDQLWVAMRYVSETRRGLRITASGNAQKLVPMMM